VSGDAVSDAVSGGPANGVPATGLLTTVHVIRHGEVYNPDHVLYGRLPGFKLSLRGLEQAKLTARHLADRDIGYVVASPLERAQQTAEPLGEARLVTVATDDRLVEAANMLEGRAVAGGKGLLTDVRNWKHLRNPFRPSWGEPYVEVAARMMAALTDARDHVRTLGAGVEAACVSHQLPIVALRRAVEGQRLYHDPRKRQCGLASVTSFTFDGDVVVRVDYAEPAGATPRGYVGGA
jgi:broad specificity phosphatase PhoE